MLPPRAVVTDLQRNRRHPVSLGVEGASPVLAFKLPVQSPTTREEASAARAVYGNKQPSLASPGRALPDHFERGLFAR